MKPFRDTGKYVHRDFINRLDAAFTAVKNDFGVTLSISAVQDMFRDYEARSTGRTTGPPGPPRQRHRPGYADHGLGVCADINGNSNGSLWTTLWKKVASIFARYELSYTVKSESWQVQDMNVSIAGNTVTINAPAAAYARNSYFPSIQAFAALQGEYRAMD